MMRKHGILTDDYYDLTKQKRKGKKRIIYVVKYHGGCIKWKDMHLR